MPGFLFDDAPVKGIYKPPSQSFVGGYVNFLDTSKAGSVELTDLAKQQILLGNPAFIEMKNAGQAALQKEWETVSRPTGFVDFIVDGFGNLAAGLVNSIVPGSNLGDEKNPSNLVGNVLGSVSSFLIPTSVISTAINKVDMSLNLGGAINFLNKTLSSPLGSLTSSLLFNPTPPSAQVAAFDARAVQNVAETKNSAAQAAIFGGTPGQQFLSGAGVNVSASTGSTSQQTIPVWAWVVGAAALVGGFLYFVFKRKR